MPFNLFNLFKKEKEQKPKEHIENLNSWIENKSNEINKALLIREQNFQIAIKGLISNLEIANQTLLNLSLENKKELEKVKTIVDENRRNYCILTERLIEKLKEHINMEHEIETKILKIKQDLDHFYPASARSYNKATYLIGKEMQSLVILLKEIQKLCNNFLEENIEILRQRNSLKEIRNLILDLQKEQIVKNETEQKINKINEEKNTAEKIKASIQEGIKNMFESEIYENLNKIKLEKEEISNKLSKTRKKVHIHINPKILERFLYYVNDKSRKKLVESYLANPIDTLIEDKEFEIINLLTLFKQNIMKGTINLDSSKKYKILSEITLDRNIFENLKNEINLFSKQLNEKEKEIDKLEKELNLRDSEDQLKEVKMKIQNYIKQSQEENTRLSNIEKKNQ